MGKWKYVVAGMSAAVILLITIGSAAYQVLSPQSSTLVPASISYQGRLTDSTGNALTGAHSMTFKLYASPGGLPGVMDGDPVRHGRQWPV